MISSLMAVAAGAIVGAVCRFRDGCTVHDYATGLQYGAMVVLILGGLGFVSDQRRPRIVTHRPDDAVSQYKHRINLLDNNLYQFVAGTIAALILYLVSKGIFWYS